MQVLRFSLVVQYYKAALQGVSGHSYVIVHYV
jgi:hypothetical protein